MATCNTCRFWHRDRGNEGECRRFPPQALLAGVANSPLGPQPAFTSAFPRIRADLGCGEHQIKIELTQ